MSLYLISFLMIFLISMILFIMALIFIYFNMIYFIEWQILNLKSCSILMTFLFDWMSLLFMSFVLFISSLVVYYSKEYMVDDNNGIRFILLILLFIFSMMMMIISPNLISILLGWDGLGLISYCLVIYFQNVKSYNASMLTVLSNRIGDVALLMAIAWMLSIGSWNYIFYLEVYLMNFSMSLISVLVMLAAMTKSAQIPFSSWLPAAMAAPTPVSALVHSSTLVTAGVYLLIRFNYLINNMISSKVLLLIGSLTMLMSGLGANFEIDLKKIIALSTLSQLGLMMSILSLGFYKMAFFHLLSHALFKALLFLCAGSFIHNMMNFQDIRLFGNFFNQMPLTSICFNISSLALCGMPFLAGFYSKDLILETMCLLKLNFLIFLIFFFATMLTVSYSLRLIFNVSIMNISSFSNLMISNESWLMLKMMMILSIFSILGGSMLSWLIFPYHSLILLPFYFKFLTIWVCLLGGILGYFLFSKLNFYYKNFIFLMIFVKNFYSSMWFMLLISTLKFNFFFLNIGFNYMKNFDYGWSELLGGYLIYKNLMNFSKFNQNFYKLNLKKFFISYIILLMILFLLFN